MDRLSELLGIAVQFVYTCWDRIVVNGYIERLQRPENLIYFFHDVVGIACIEPKVLEQRTNAYAHSQTFNFHGPFRFDFLRICPQEPPSDGLKRKAGA